MWQIRELAWLVVHLFVAVLVGAALGWILSLVSAMPFVESCRWAFVVVGLIALSMAAAPGESLNGRVGSSFFGGGKILWGGGEPNPDTPRINPTAQLIVIGAAAIALAAFL